MQQSLIGKEQRSKLDDKYRRANFCSNFAVNSKRAIPAFHHNLVLLANCLTKKLANSL